MNKINFPRDEAIQFCTKHKNFFEEENLSENMLFEDIENEWKKYMYSTLDFNEYVEEWRRSREENEVMYIPGDMTFDFFRIQQRGKLF